MIKFVLKLFVILLFVVSPSVFAGLITTNLVNDVENDKLTFIQYKGYDWTWASTVNVSSFSVTDPLDFSNTVTNTFKDASFRADSGWRSFSKDSEIHKIFMELTIDNFMHKGKVIHSLQYWNTEFDKVEAADIDNFVVGRRSGEKRADTMPNFTLYETFYVRKSIEVPEPSTLFIFSLSVLALFYSRRSAL